MKNDAMPNAKPTLRLMRRTKKFARSNIHPQTGLMSRRATFGTTPVRSAIMSGRITRA